MDLGNPLSNTWFRFGAIAVMERSGMRWTLEGARSMLHVRAAFQSDHWEAFLGDRIKRETERTHPHRHLLDNYQPMTLAC